jgi:hypothetical protein
MATDPVDALPSSNRRDGHLWTACPADAGDLRAPADREEWRIAHSHLSLPQRS